MIVRAATYFTPDLVLTRDSLQITGKLWMENPAKYFEKIMIETQKSDSSEFTVLLDVDYVNSSSTKQLLNYFKLLSDLKEGGIFTNVLVIWKIEEDDSDMKELICELMEISGLNIVTSFNKI